MQYALGVFIRTWDMSWGLRTQGGRESGWGYRKSHLGWDMTHTIFIYFIYTCTQACWHPVDSCLAFPAGAHIFSRAPSPEFREAEHQWAEMAEISRSPVPGGTPSPPGPRNLLEPVFKLRDRRFLKEGLYRNRTKGAEGGEGGRPALLPAPGV